MTSPISNESQLIAVVEAARKILHRIEQGSHQIPSPTLRAFYQNKAVADLHDALVDLDRRNP